MARTSPSPPGCAGPALGAASARRARLHHREPRRHRRSIPTCVREDIRLKRSRIVRRHSGLSRPRDRSTTTGRSERCDRPRAHHCGPHEAWRRPQHRPRYPLLWRRLPRPYRAFDRAERCHPGSGFSCPRSLPRQRDRSGDNRLLQGLAARVTLARARSESELARRSRPPRPTARASSLAAGTSKTQTATARAVMVSDPLLCPV
jgi:hypothetical protein